MVSQPPTPPEYFDGIPRARFRELTSYLHLLPHGLESYPECRTKASLIRSSLDGHAFHPSWEQLPELLRETLRSPPLPVVWAPAVLAKAVFCVVADTYYPSVDLVREWSHKRGLRLANSAAYRVLTRVTGVRNLLRATGRVNDMFQRGSGMLVETHQLGATLRLSHPKHLHPPLSHIANQAGFLAILEATGAKDIVVDLARSDPTGAVYELRFAG